MEIHFRLHEGPVDKKSKVKRREDAVGRLSFLSSAMTEAEALVVLPSRFVRRHFFMFSTMVPTSAVSGSDCQKTEVFKGSQVF